MFKLQQQQRWQPRKPKSTGINWDQESRSARDREREREISNTRDNEIYSETANENKPSSQNMTTTKETKKDSLFVCARVLS